MWFHTTSISIHALLAESDDVDIDKMSTKDKFLSTLSLRRATTCGMAVTTTLPISIHALLAESDPQTPDTLPGGAISIHALLAESDSGHRSATRGCGRFLSTLSLRRATHPGSIFLPVLNFYPRSPCGERRLVSMPPWCEPSISIHALLAESDHTLLHVVCVI